MQFALAKQEKKEFSFWLMYCHRMIVIERTCEFRTNFIALSSPQITICIVPILDKRRLQFFCNLFFFVQFDKIFSIAKWLYFYGHHDLAFWIRWRTSVSFRNLSEGVEIFNETFMDVLNVTKKIRIPDYNG